MSMIPKPRVVHAYETVKEPVETSNDPREEKPRVTRPLTEIDRIERSIRLTDMALHPFEDKLERRIAMTAEEQRLMVTHQTMLIKLEMSKAALEAKAELGKKSNADLARTLKMKGWDREQILALFNHSREVEAALDDDSV